MIQQLPTVIPLNWLITYQLARTANGDDMGFKTWITAEARLFTAIHPDVAVANDWHAFSAWIHEKYRPDVRNKPDGAQ